MILNSLARLRKVIVLSASFLFLFNACKKDGALLPDFEDNTTFSFFTDSVLIGSTTLIGDSVLADRIATGLVGLYKDSAFGITRSNLYVQPQLPNNSLIFGESDETFVIDSIVLSLEISGYFGDTTLPQTFDVYRLTEKLETETNYYSDTSIATESTILGSGTFTPFPNKKTTIHQPNSTGGVDTIEVNAQVRIPLDNNFGTDLLSKSGATELSDNDNFTDYFRGIKVSARDPGNLMNNQNAIIYFLLTASNTKVALYYKSITPQADTTPKVVNFPISAASVRFNTFEHDYTGSAVETVLQNPGTPSSFGYIQALAGVESVIRFPNLTSLFKNKILVNKAELIIPVASGSYDQFGVANTIIAASRDNSGSLQFIPDFLEEDDSYFGGSYDENSRTYTFNIARYIQGVLNGTQDNNGLTILVRGSAVKAERVVFLSENNAGSKIHLNLYYTNTQ